MGTMGTPHASPWDRFSDRQQGRGRGQRGRVLVTASLRDWRQEEEKEEEQEQ